MPRVEPDVVVVAAGGHKQGAGIAADHHVEPEHAVVERLGLRDVGDLEMHVADRGAGGSGRLRAGRLRKLAEHVPQVQREGRHLQRVVVVAPLVARPVAIELDAVAVGV